MALADAERTSRRRRYLYSVRIHASSTLLCYTQTFFFFRGEGVGKRRNAEQQAMEIVGVFQTGSDEVNRTWQLVGVFQSLKSSPSFPLGRRMEGKRIQRQAK